MKKQIILMLLLTFFSTLTFAHPGHMLSNFYAGFMHPFFGFDHLLVMISVGLLGSKVGEKATWQLPLTFLIAMGVGVLLGVIGLNMGLLEMAISTSLILMGALLCFHTRQHIYFVIVAIVAILHGMAHGIELNLYQNQIGVIGMLLATSLLLGLGFLINQQHQLIKHVITSTLAVMMIVAGSLFLFN
jgi:urease accessory protein